MPRPKRAVPWLDQRGDKWYVFWYDEKTKRTERLSLRTSDEDEAKGRYIAFLTEGSSVLRRPAHAGVTVAEVIDCYLMEHVGWNPLLDAEVPGVNGVADKYRQKRAGEVLKIVWGDTPVTSIDIPECRRYVETRASMKPPAGHTTARRELNMLVAAVNHAVRWKRLTADQVPSIELPAHAPPDETKWLTKTEVKTLFDAAAEHGDPRVRAFCVLAYFAGARRKSIERLTVSQVDLERRRLHLDPVGAARTKKRRPVVPITDEMAREIKKLMLKTETEYLFGSAGYDVYKVFRRLCQKCGFGDRSNPHILRHSRATHMLMDGVAMWEVAKLLGDTAQTVDKVYGHHCPDHMASSQAFGSIAGVLGE
ncbi:MAG: site-specific integrase [Pseudomonadota bacterium]